MYDPVIFLLPPETSIYIAALVLLGFSCFFCIAALLFPFCTIKNYTVARSGINALELVGLTRGVYFNGQTNVLGAS